MTTPTGNDIANLLDGHKAYADKATHATKPTREQALFYAYRQHHAAILSALREGERLRGALEEVEAFLTDQIGYRVEDASGPAANKLRHDDCRRLLNTLARAALSSAKEPGHDA